MALRIYNTLINEKDRFLPGDPDDVQMFVCGPTVYDLSHVGHARTYTHFDFVARYLRRLGFGVHYLQNITDVDDKIIRRANEVGMEPRQLARKYEQLYREDMAALGNTSVDTYARAHDHIDEIVDQIQRLIEGGHAYELSDGWYFDLASFPRYGRLSGRTEVAPEDSVARIDQSPEKRNPGDFALWKARRPGEPYWSTALGEGRPGWHIEDTAITERFFGPQYDLHGGAVDLVFPHHEAEIAQMEAASGKQPLARSWMHAGLVRQDGSKMSKSTGNVLTIRDALDRSDFRTLRYAFLSHHYRSPMELSTEVLDQARSARRRVENFARSVDRSTREPEGSRTAVHAARAAFFDRLDDDLDTPGASGRCSRSSVRRIEATSFPARRPGPSCARSRSCSWPSSSAGSRSRTRPSARGSPSGNACAPRVGTRRPTPSARSCGRRASSSRTPRREPVGGEPGDRRR